MYCVMLGFYESTAEAVMPSFLSEYNGARIHVRVYTLADGVEWAGEIVITQGIDTEVERRFVPRWHKVPQSEEAAYRGLLGLARKIVDGKSAGYDVEDG
jgi:hypothetical protein